MNILKIAYSIIVYCFFCTFSFAQQVKIDSSFAENGIISFSPEDEVGLFFESVQLSDGSYIVSSISIKMDETSHIELWKYSEDGVLDDSFGVNGVYTINSFDDESLTSLILLDNDQVATTSFRSRDTIIIDIINADGELENQLKYLMKDAYNRKLKYSNGSLYIGTTISSKDENDKLSILKSDLDGHLDHGFGNEGVLRIGKSSFHLNFNDMLLQGNEMVLFYGSYSSIENSIDKGNIIRIKNGQELDTSFGASGVISIENFGIIGLGQLFEDDTSNIYCTDVRYNVVYKFDKDGKVDPNYGINGVAFHLDISDSLEKTFSAIQSDGKMLMFGINYGNFSGISNAYILRFDEFGQLDNSLDDGVLLNFTEVSNSIFYNGIVDRNGDILSMGSINYIDEPNNQFLMVKFTDVILGLFDVSKPKIDFEVFPNPTSDILMFNTNNSTLDATISIYSSMGELVIEHNLSNSSEINVSGLTTGMYFVKMETKGGYGVKMFNKE